MRAGPASRLKDVLDKAGVKAGAVQVRFNGLDEPVVADGPDFMKSLAVDHARDGEVMIAYAMNGQPLPLLNGFPLRLVVPGWYATYWIKMLNDIEVLDQPDANFWMKTAYTIPDTPHADMKPGQSRRDDGADQPHGPALLHHQPESGRHDPRRQADAGARHRLRRRQRREAGGFLRPTAARAGMPRGSARTRASTASAAGRRISRRPRRAATR